MKIRRVILTLFLISLFHLNANNMSKIISSNENTQEIIFATQGYTSFVEDFSNTTYRDGATTAFGWGTGGVTAARNYSWDWLDLYMTTNPITDIDVHGRKVFAACFDPVGGTHTMASFYINDPSNIIQMSDDDSTIGPYAITVEGDVLYLGYAAGTIRVNTYNISNPYLPSGTKYLDSTYADGRVTDVEADGHLMYYASYDDSGDDSFRIIDASDPDAMIEISSNWVSNKTLGLHVDYPIAYLAESDNGLYIVNTTVKTAVTEIGHVDTPGNATDVIVDGGYAYVADGPAGVQIVNVLNPNAPWIMGTYDTPGNARKLVKQGNTLFVADGSGGVIVLDVADKQNPTFVTQKYPFPFGDANDVDLFGGILVVGADLGLYTYEIAAIGGGITDFSEYAYLNAYSDYNAFDVRVRGGIAYVAGGADGLYTLDVRNPDNPILLDQHVYSAGRNYKRLEIRGNFAYVADYGGGGGLRIYDVSNPFNIFQTDFTGLSYASDVALSGDYAYVADGSFGVYIFDISDPYNIPAVINWFDDGFNNITSVWIEGPHLYCVDHDAGVMDDCFYIYDMRDVLNEALTTVDDLTSYCYDVKVDGDIAYVGDTDWLVLYNVSDKYSYDYIHSAYIGHFLDSYGVWNFGPYVMSAAGAEGIYLVNETDFGSVTATNYADATGAIQVSTHGDFTYVANQSSLIILRHFESAGDTYVPGLSFAQSLEMDSTTSAILRATLYVNDYIPPGSLITYFMSADGGNNWEAVTPNVEHEFINIGDDLRWRVEIEGFRDRSPHLYEISIQYYINEAPTEPTLNDPGDITETSTVAVTWSTSTDDNGIDHYELQVDTDMVFATPIDSYNVSGTTQFVGGLTNGTYYFRVRAVDMYDAASTWSGIVDIDVQIPALDLEWWHYVIVFGGLAAIILVIVVVVMVRKKKKVPTR
jgi:hypothetical protein